MTRLSFFAEVMSNACRRHDTYSFYVIVSQFCCIVTDLSFQNSNLFTPTPSGPSLSRPLAASSLASTVRSHPSAPTARIWLWTRSHGGPGSQVSQIWSEWRNGPWGAGAEPGSNLWSRASPFALPLRHPIPFLSCVVELSKLSECERPS